MWPQRNRSWSCCIWKTVSAPTGCGQPRLPHHEYYRAAELRALEEKLLLIFTESLAAGQGAFRLACARCACFLVGREGRHTVKSSLPFMTSAAHFPSK